MTDQPRVMILLVDEVLTRGRRRRDALALEGWSPALVARTTAAAQALEEYRPDVLILGGATALELELLRDLRNGDIELADYRTKAVVVGVDDETTATIALRLGADVILPSSASESLLIAGVRNADRRLRIGDMEMSRLGDITVDRQLREVKVAGQSLTTTNREFDLLAAMTSQHRRVWSRNELAMAIWGSRHMADHSRAIDAHISHLNSKVRERGLGPILDNAWGKGYVISSARSDQNLGLGL